MARIKTRLPKGGTLILLWIGVIILLGAVGWAIGWMVPRVLAPRETPTPTQMARPTATPTIVPVPTVAPAAPEATGTEIKKSARKESVVAVLKRSFDCSIIPFSNGKGSSWCLPAKLGTCFYRRTYNKSGLGCQDPIRVWGSFITLTLPNI